MNDLFNESTHGAEFSKCGKYRYKLFRIWNRELPLVMAIGLNPSTANANKNDQTINYLILMLTKLGYGGFYMMNCWPYIASKPELLMRNEITDEWNDNIITITANECQDVIFCWGNFKIIRETGRDKQLIKMFQN